MPWLRMSFKSRKQKVYAEVDDDQVPIEASPGKVHIRYSMSDERVYSAAISNLMPIPGEEAFDVPDPQTAAPDTTPLPKTSLSVVEKPRTIPTTPPPDVLLAFTDGACTGNPGPAGLGAILLFGEHKREIREFLGNGTNNIAELTAILRTLEAIKDPSRTIHLYTDSSYAIGVLAKGWKAKKNKELIGELRRVASSFSDLTLFKVKGHAGHPLNERADELAREAIERRDSADDNSTATATEVPDLPEAHLLPKPSLSVVEKPRTIPTSPPPDVLLAFTDGACTGNPGPAGLGAILLFGEHKREIREFLGNGTNNIAELTAILRTLEAIKDPSRTIHLYTDSSYAIGVLAKGWKAKKNKELIAALKGLASKFTALTLFKVKGHAGHPLNERADELAREAISARSPMRS